MSKGWKYLWLRDVGAISAPAARTVRCASESGAAAGSRCSVGRGPRTADRRPPTMSTQQILFQDQVRPRPRRERASGARPVHALGFEATLLTQPAASPRSLRSRTRARNLTKVRGPRARGLWTRAMPDLGASPPACLHTVTRLQCRLTEEGYDMHLDLDVNTDLWPLELGERFTFALASTLSLDGAPDAGAHTRHGKHRTATARMQVALAAYGTH